VSDFLHRTDDWDYPKDFDFIHTRVTLGCWADMKTELIQRAFAHLKPGGWLECQEVLAMPVCDDDTMPPNHAFLRWCQDTAEASAVANRQMLIGPELKQWMIEAGFVDVQQVVFKLPLNGWPKDRLPKHIGMMWQRNLLIGLSGFSLALLHRIKGRSMEDIEVSNSK
jgi:metalloendopeptidase OMA1, mitochondrial